MSDPAPSGGAVEVGDPSEVRTFLIADVRDYTRFTQERGDEAGAALAGKFATLARGTIEGRGGRVLELRGDEALAVFGSPRQAIRAAVELQARFEEETAVDPGLPLTVGMGLDAGEAVPVEGGYRGGALNLAARLCSAAAPGEVLVTEGLVHLARKIEGLAYVDRGALRFKGFAEPVQVMRVVPSAPGSSGGRKEERAESGVRELPSGAFLGAVPERSLVAREQELGQIMAAIDAVEGGAGRFVLLAGEPGVGKTRLAQEVMVVLRPRGFLVATGRCYEPEQTVPFYPFREALSIAYAAAPSSVRTGAVRRWPQLARILPEQIGAPPVSSSTPEEEQQRLFWAIAGFIQAIGELMPIALLLDDLHWADESSLKLLQHLVRHTRGHRVLGLGTYRDVEVGRQHPLGRAVLDLNREGLVERVMVRRLDHVGTAALMAATLGVPEVDADLAALIHARTDGNPFFVQEVVRALVERGDVYREQGRWRRRTEEMEVPENVRAVIEQRLSRLSERAQEALREASVLGQTFVFDELQGIRGRDEEELEATLAEVVAAGLVREVDRDDYTFNHALTQQALYAELSPRRRRRLHLAAAEAVERQANGNRMQRAATLARHFLAGKERRRALSYALLAGDQAEAMFAHVEAEQQYRTALALVRELRAAGGHGERQTQAAGELAALEAEALEKLGTILRIVACYDEALEALEQATAIYRDLSDLEGEGRVTAQIGFVHHLKGAPREGIGRIQALLHSIQTRGSSALSSHVGLSLYAALANLFILSGSYGESLEAGDRAGELARAAGNNRMLAEVGVVRGSALLLSGRQEDALRVLEEAIELAQAVDDVDILSLALDAASEVYVVRGELLRSSAFRERALDLFMRLGDPAKMAYGLANLGYVTFYLGDWGKARYQFQEAMERIQPLSSSWIVAAPLLGLGMCSLAEGDREAAARYLEECVAISEQGGSPDALTHGQRLLAERDLMENRPDIARTRLEPLLEHPGLAEHNAPVLLAVLAQAYLRMGETTRAEQRLHESIERALAGNARLALAEARCVEGLLRTEQGRWEDAHRAFDQAASLAGDMHYLHLEARARYEHGVLYIRLRSSEQARALIGAALEIFARLGARRDVDRAEHMIAALDGASS